MRLVIDTATDACSVALFDDEILCAERHEILKRGHAEKLLPMIADLPEGGRADEILVDCGPGSFTGVRVGLAAAQALGLGWDAKAAGYSSMALLAAMAFAEAPERSNVAVALHGGHGEIFVQRFCRNPFEALEPLRSLTPEMADRAVSETLIAGNAASMLAAMADERTALDLLPHASKVALLPQRMRSLPMRPVYGRPPDAKPPQ